MPPCRMECVGNHRISGSPVESPLLAVGQGARIQESCGYIRVNGANWQVAVRPVTGPEFPSWPPSADI